MSTPDGTGPARLSPGDEQARACGAEGLRRISRDPQRGAARGNPRIRKSPPNPSLRGWASGGAISCVRLARGHAEQPGGRARLHRADRGPRHRDAPVSDQSIAAQRAALEAYGAAKDPSYAHLKGLRLPVLVVNGSDDIVVPTINSYILQQFLPDAELVLYPDANHGAHFQYPELFVRHARIFLDTKPILYPKARQT